MRARLIAACAGVCGTLFLGACSGHPPGHTPKAENREQITDFQTLFQSNCSGCHGDNGRMGPARILNDALYLSIVPRDTLRRTIAYGRSGTEMPAWAKSEGGPLTDKQIDILVDGIYSHWGNGRPAPAGVPEYAETGGGDANHGKLLFMRSCFMCHAKNMQPGPITTPGYLELASNQMLRTSIIVGRMDLGMPSYRFLNMGKPLSNQDVTDLVAYLNSLRTAPAPAAVSAPAGQQTSGGSQGGVR